MSERQQQGRAFACVLYAEDEPQLRLMFQAVLEKAGYRVLAAGDGPTLLRLCQAHDGEAHLLLTDIQMPGMDGMELARRVKALRPGIKVAFISASSRQQWIDEGRLSAQDCFIEKPVLISEFLRAISELLA